MLFVSLSSKAARRAMRFLVAAAILCALALAFFGLPLPRQGEKDRSTPFPCQDRPCGCLDAASCWKECCCFTHEQKLAWAKKNGVTPPAICAAAKPKSCDDEHGDECCHRVTSSEERRAVVDPQQKSQGSVVLAGAWRHCRGLGALWLVLSHALPVTPTSPPALEGATGHLVLLSDAAREIAAPPSSPPPRRG